MDARGDHTKRDPEDHRERWIAARAQVRAERQAAREAGINEGVTLHPEVRTAPILPLTGSAC